MKKVKLLTSLSSIGVLLTATPIIATSCSEKNINENEINDVKGNEDEKLVSEFGNYIRGFSLPDGLYVERTYTSQIGLKSSTNLVIYGVEGKIEEGTSECLHVTVDGNTITVAPSMDALHKHCHILIGAYLDNVCVNKLDYYIETIQYASNFMIYDGVEYALEDYFDPNCFCTKYDIGFNIYIYHSQDIPLKNGKTITIGGSEEEGSKLTSVTFSKCYHEHSGISPYFLAGCKGLKEVDLGEICNVGGDVGPYIDDHFLYGCTSLKYIYAPAYNPESVKIDDKCFMEDVPSDCTIYCRQWLNAYKETSPGSQRADYMDGNQG